MHTGDNRRYHSDAAAHHGIDSRHGPRNANVDQCHPTKLRRCSLCCKLAELVELNELNKPAGVWCRHCAPGRGGCTIYETRPPVCRNWNCNWIVEPGLGPEWQPLICKMILYYENDGRRLCVRVDPGYADAWRREPYYSQLKQCSRTALEAK